MGITIYAVVSRKQYASGTYALLTHPYNRRMETIADRLRRLMAEGRVSQYKLWKMSGISQPTIKRILDGESKEPDKSTVTKLAAALDCSYAWLYDGSEQSIRRGYALGTLESWDDSTPLDDDEVEIPLFKEVEISAGGGHSHAVEINGRKLRFSRVTMRSAGVDPANAACASVSGNSMERLILDGATIGIDRGRTRVADGEIYAIDHDGMLRVKYLYRQPGGGLRLRSENREEHPDENYTAEEAVSIRVLGWVFWWSTVRKWRGK